MDGVRLTEIVEKMKSMKSFWHIKYRVLYSVMIFSRNLSL